ncbi:MAG: AAA family ATPase [Sutterella wadsworthensis]
MRLLKLRIENINSLAGRYEIDFTNRDYVESGIFAIVGPTGSGKTTILDAVTLALFGKTPRMETRTSTSKKTDRGCMVLTEGRKQCSASVVFESMGKFWRSRWSVRLKRTGEPRDAQVELVRLPDGSAETGEIVAEQKLAWNAKVPEVLGMDYETFTRSALLAQGAFTELLRAQVDDRAAILEKITGTKLYSTIGQWVFERCRDENNKVKRLLVHLEGAEMLAEDARKALETALETTADEAQHVRLRRSELEADLRWIRQATAARARLKDAEQSFVQAEKAAQASQALKREAAAARSAVEPLAERRRMLDCAASAEAHRREAAQYEAAQVQAQAHQAQAQAAADVARQAALQAAEDEAKTIPELEQMEEKDKCLAIADAEAQASSAALADAQARSLRADAEVQKCAAALKSAEDERRRALGALEMLQGDRELAEHLPAAAAAAEAYADAKKNSLNAKSAAALGEKKIAADKVKADEAHDAAVKAQAVMEAAAQRLQDAQRLQAAVYQEGSLEVKLVEMRRFTGRAWAAQWFLECGELLGLLSEMPSGDKTSRMREVLTHRIEALRSAYPQDFAEALTPQRAAGFNAVLDAIETWSKNAKRRIKRRSCAEEIKAVNAFHEAQAADVRASARLRAAQESLEQLQAQQRESAERLQVRRDAFLLAAKHCFAADTDSKAVLAEPQSFLNEAEARRQRYAAADASAQKAQEKLTAASAAANAAAAQKRGADEAQTAASERAQAAHQAAQDVRKDRENKFGKRSAQAERRELAHRVRTSREKERNAAQASAQAAQHLKTIEATLSAEKRRRKFAQKTEDAKARFSELLANAAFADEAALLAAERDPARIKELEQTAEAAGQAYAAAESNRATAQRDLEALLQTPHRDVQEAEAAAELAQTDERASEAERRLGSLRQQLEADDAVRRKAALIEAELKTARTSADKWAKLSGLIGSADGKTFRLAAQSLTFALLLHEANMILSRMQSRYQLIRPVRKKLDLAVRDLELAGLERTSFNLSGGETFLVSLALALALSRVSSSRMQVDTLFLDEGFGTLDPDTLEKALNALEMLQQKTGKLIGIISHVRAVRERVGVHIVVKPRGTSGESEVSGPGVRFEAQPAA